MQRVAPGMTLLTLASSGENLGYNPAVSKLSAVVTSHSSRLSPSQATIGEISNIPIGGITRRSGRRIHSVAGCAQRTHGEKAPRPSHAGCDTDDERELQDQEHPVHAQPDQRHGSAVRGDHDLEHGLSQVVECRERENSADDYHDECPPRRAGGVAASTDDPPLHRHHQWLDAASEKARDGIERVDPARADEPVGSEDDPGQH